MQLNNSLFLEEILPIFKKLFWPKLGFTFYFFTLCLDGLLKCIQRICNGLRIYVRLVCLLDLTADFWVKITVKLTPICCVRRAKLRWEFIKENKNSTKKVIKKKRKFFFFFLGRVLVFFLVFLIAFLFSFINSHLWYSEL